MSGEVENFNFDKLEKELQDTVAKEKQYWLENDAKIRAVKQGVPTYDHFRELVMGAHLKPLDKGEKMDSFVKPRNQPWNVSVGSSTSNSAESHSSSDTLKTSALSSQLPANHAAFNLTWKRISSEPTDVKYQFLLRYPREEVNISEVFKTDLPSSIFTECCSVLRDGFATEDEDDITQILQGFAASKRFSLTFSFLSTSERQILNDLFNKFSVCDSELAQKFKITQ